MSQHENLASEITRAWAQAHALGQANPVEFGHNAAKVYLAALQTLAHAGDEKATAAALAALSIPSETLQAIAQLSSLSPRCAADSSHAGSVGAGA